MALYGQCQAGAQINFPESGRGLGHVPLTIFGSTVGYQLGFLFYIAQSSVETMEVKWQVLIIL